MVRGVLTRETTQVRPFHVLTHVLPALRRRASRRVPPGRAQAARRGNTGRNALHGTCAREGLIEFKSPLAHRKTKAPDQSGAFVVSSPQQRVGAGMYASCGCFTPIHPREAHKAARSAPI